MKVSQLLKNWEIYVFIVGHVPVYEVFKMCHASVCI
uniref:Uncharacterized protein n=1 Tax=Rhizophora mucronata TaxID=61149 RepID=A0A2P2IWQ2_RHIMU